MIEITPDVTAASTDSLPSARNDAATRGLGRASYDQYFSLHEVDHQSSGYLQLLADAIGRVGRPQYGFTAGWVYAETALKAQAWDSESRAGLLDTAGKYWRAVLDNPRTSTELGCRALLAICHRPTLDIVSEAANEGYFHPVLEEVQEEEYCRFFDYYLDNWNAMSEHGLAFEALNSYFMHRSNRLRPAEPPILPLIASVREDHHVSPGRRIDVAYYETGRGEKFGAQLKAGYMAANPRTVEKERKLRRILLHDARRWLCIPHGEGKLFRTMEAIADQNERFELDLDVIALEQRLKLQTYFGNTKRSLARIRLRR